MIPGMTICSAVQLRQSQSEEKWSGFTYFNASGDHFAKHQLLRNYLIHLLMDNGLTIALGVGAVAALGVVLGLLKKLIASLFSAAVNAGDSAVAQLAAKPN